MSVLVIARSAIQILLPPIILFRKKNKTKRKKQKTSLPKQDNSRIRMNNIDHHLIGGKNQDTLKLAMIEIDIHINCLACKSPP